MTTTPETTPGVRWPYPDIVKMTAHRGSGQWRKRYGGVDYYFGPIDDPDSALARWRVEWPRIVEGHDRHAGVEAWGNKLTLYPACREFLRAKKAAFKRGEIVWVTFVEYRYTCRLLVRALGKQRAVITLGPSDFRKVHHRISDFTPTRRGNTIIKIRSIFKWLYDNGHLEKPTEFGSDFRRPPKRLIRRARSEAGARLFSGQQIRLLLSISPPWFQACVLLGINGGFGNSDLSHIPSDMLKDQWLSGHRHKTWADRRVPLWPETYDALVKARQRMPAGEWLLCGPNGRALVHGTTDRVGKTARRLIRQAPGLQGRTFYDLRRTFATVAAELGDDHAAKIIMGHTIDGVHEGYVQEFPDQRLLRVTAHVRKWVLKSPGPDLAASLKHCGDEIASASSEPEGSETA